jgi:mRNA-degrading endonuclease RelE of RelBE toxin-antitoxin system
LARTPNGVCCAICVSASPAARKGLWRYRVDDYRIVAAIEDNRFVVLVVTVGHRREVYR